MTFRQTLKRITPYALWNVFREMRNTFHRLPEIPGAYFHPWRRASIHSLAQYKDTHTGKRCFVIGNGPSLRRTDLTKLRDEYTFGMNRIYLLFPELGFTTTYFVSVNNLVIEQCVGEIRALPVPKFLTWRARHIVHPSPEMIYLYTTYTGPKFAHDVRERIWEGATVTYVALQLAYHMGFSQVILLGVDHSFTTKGPANTTVVSQGKDPDHFHSAYFGRGFRWQLPDLETSERAYRMARNAYETAGRQVLDATINGKLTVFQKVDYNSLF